jgi:hypothetical protein
MRGHLFGESRHLKHAGCERSGYKLAGSLAGRYGRRNGRIGGISWHSVENIAMRPEHGRQHPTGRIV